MRSVAVLFLLLAVTDLAFPELCRENKTLLPESSSETAVVAAQSDSDPSSPASREDCFCCCSHLVSAESRILLSHLPETSSALVRRPPASPPVQAQSFFRPPRVA